MPTTQRRGTGAACDDRRSVLARLSAKQVRCFCGYHTSPRFRRRCNSYTSWRAWDSASAWAPVALTRSSTLISEARRCAIAPRRRGRPAHRAVCGQPCGKSDRRRLRRAWQAIAANMEGPTSLEHGARRRSGGGKQGKASCLILQTPDISGSWRLSF